MRPGLGLPYRDSVTQRFSKSLTVAPTGERTFGRIKRAIQVALSILKLPYRERQA